MFDRILVPTDGSGPATAALELAAKVAPPSATVHLLFVSEADGVDDTDAESPVTAETATDAAEPTGDEILADASELATVAGLSVVTAVRTGVPRERILEYATTHDIEMIAMGQHGRRRVGRLELGTETRDVVRDASMPVLVVRASDDVRRVYPFRRILVPTDGSDQASAAVDLGIETAAETGATLDLLSVVSVTRYGTDAKTDQLIDHLEKNARSALETAAADAADDVDVRTAVSVGTVHREISAYAERKDVDLLVMGTHGRSDVERELLGSVTERVLRTAPVPVLTVRAPESE
ncbi:universal stress protein [Natrinema caseinilyticum]|uniref:universal stress protein n=1 Tax=Natrinema caseinilyticum TaxID=2961570 RepID=UPI0020C3D05C|nr:universal stress protein [Natrinema caseinilyticum]